MLRVLSPWSSAICSTFLQCWAISSRDYVEYLRGQENWKGLQTTAMIRSERHLGEKVEIKNRAFISSLKMDAKALLIVKSSHWGIENGLHWALDIGFQEDRSRVRKDRAPENFVVLRHMAVNLLKQEKTLKVSIQPKRMQAAWKEPYLLKVLAG